MAYFPMFIDIENKNCLVVGGGNVALRKVKVLLDFGAVVTVVADQICKEIEQLAAESLEEVSGETDSSYSANRLILQKRGFLPEDVNNKALVIAATNHHDVNHLIAEQAKAAKIPVNAVDQVEDCTFIFPAYLKQQNVVAAFSSSGNAPVITQYLKKKEKEILTPELGDINEALGKAREYVKAKYETEAERKAAYTEMLEFALREGKMPEYGE